MSNPFFKNTGPYDINYLAKIANVCIAVFAPFGGHGSTHLDWYYYYPSGQDPVAQYLDGCVHKIYIINTTGAHFSCLRKR